MRNEERQNIHPSPNITKEDEMGRGACITSGNYVIRMLCCG
jgi:hypothetical protein